VRLYLEGRNFCRIGRILSVNHQSVDNWVNAYFASLPAIGQPVTSPERLEMDKMFTFVGSKKARPTSSPSRKKDALCHRVGDLRSAGAGTDAVGG
jgi:hypothetical protein